MAFFDPDWQRDAACVDLDVDPFGEFDNPASSDDIELVLEACAECHVRAECRRSWPGAPWGVWGGKTGLRLAVERRALLAVIPPAPAPAEADGQRVCRGFGTSLAGRPRATMWCTTKCRTRHHTAA